MATDGVKIIDGDTAYVPIGVLWIYMIARPNFQQSKKNFL